MNIQTGFYYHIKDIFFEEVRDNALMANKEAENYRPLSLHSTTTKLIANSLEYNLRLHKRGVPLFYTDINRIYEYMKIKMP